MKRNYLISYIEDNELGVYSKDLLVQADDFIDCCITYARQYPTLFGAKEVFGNFTDEWKHYYSHDAQDTIQLSNIEIGRNIFNGE